MECQKLYFVFLRSCNVSISRSDKVRTTDDLWLLFWLSIINTALGKSVIFFMFCFLHVVQKQTLGEMVT